MRTLIKLTAFVLLIIAIIIGCQKLSEPDIQLSLNDDFTVASAKKWYIQSFQRTSIWKNAWSTAKKFSDWKNGIYYKNNNFEFLVFPLLKQKSRFLIPSDSSLSTAQIQKIAGASLSRVAFIRNANHEVFVREVDYIPDWQYLQGQQFDISKACYGKTGDDFTGTMIVKDWNEKILSMRILRNGKIIKTVSLNGTTSNNNLQNRVNSCYWVQYCMWYEDCQVIGDEWTNNCGEPYMDPNDCYYDYVCDGGGDDPCTLYGIGCDEGGGGDPPPPPDPCSDAQPSANRATTLSQNSTYTTSKGNIQNAASDGNEHSVTFGKDANGNVTASAITTGGTSGGNVDQNWPGAFSDIHNHPNDQPPSPGDMYNLISLDQNHSGWNTRFVITPDGSVYALVIISLNTATTFVSNYPSINLGFGPDFPDAINDDFIDAKNSALSQGFNNLIAEEMAMAFVLDKYNSGIALLKQDSNGNFKRIVTTETVQPDGSKIYTKNNCQ